MIESKSEKQAAAIELGDILLTNTAREVGSLRSEIETLKAALEAAHARAQLNMVENNSLRAQLATAVKGAFDSVEVMAAENRSLRIQLQEALELAKNPPLN